jgi:hypothetical protein
LPKASRVLDETRTLKTTSFGSRTRIFFLIELSVSSGYFDLKASLVDAVQSFPILLKLFSGHGDVMVSLEPAVEQNRMARLTEIKPKTKNKWLIAHSPFVRTFGTFFTSFGNVAHHNSVAIPHASCRVCMHAKNVIT